MLLRSEGNWELVVADARKGLRGIFPTLRRLHLMHRDVSLCKSRRLTPLSQANIAGMDIPDASASLRNSLPALPGYRQFVGNSAWCACVK